MYEVPVLNWIIEVEHPLIFIFWWSNSWWFTCISLHLTARLSSKVEPDTIVPPRCCGHTPSSQISKCGTSTWRRRCLRDRPTTGSWGVGRSVPLRRHRRNPTAGAWSPSGGSCGRATTTCAKWCLTPSQSCCRTYRGWRRSWDKHQRSGRTRGTKSRPHRKLSPNWKARWEHKGGCRS